MEYMWLPIKRYFDFSGRSRRKEDWMCVLFQIIVLAVLFVIGGVFGAFNEPADDFATVWVVLIGLVYLVLFFIPSISVQVRRFHDQDKSGWMILLGFIPYIGGLIVLVFMCLDGTPGPNRYGEDPKGVDTSVFE